MQPSSQASTRSIRRQSGHADEAVASGGPFKPVPGPPLAELPFDDGSYRRIHLAAEDIEAHEGRVEFWDGATETAIEVREVSPYHERPAHLLAALAERIATVRGKPIRCFGTMDLTLPKEDGRPARMMQADQSLYLHPQRADIVGPSAMVVGTNHYPDVVLEVDRTTDVRRHKLKLYEAWRFPELWVDVPDESPRPRAAHGTTIYLLQEGAFQVADESRAFPGWSAADIHTALNEERMSAHTAQVLERIGTVLGAREGTGPDDDLLLRSQRDQARREAREEALRQAREEAAWQALGIRAGELELRAAMVRRLMIARGLEVAADFPIHEREFAEAAGEAIADAAMQCDDEADFIVQLQRAKGR